MRLPSVGRSISVAWDEATGANMSKLWHRVRNYYLTHDGIEMLLFACVLGFLGWMAYHAVVGVIERFG